MKIFRKLRKKNCRRHVAYKLAGENRNKKSVLCKKSGKEFVYGIYSCKVAGKNEEKEEGSEKGIVNFIKSIFINKEKNYGDNCKTEPERDYSENDKKREGEKNHIENGLFNMELFGKILMEGKFFGSDEETRNGKHRYCKKEGRKHNCGEFRRGDFEERIKIKVLRVSERGEHSAKVCGNVLKNEKIGHVFVVLRYGKGKVSKRKKGDKRHIVCDYHGTDESYYNKQKKKPAEVSGKKNQFSCKNGEEFYVAKGGNDGKSKEKTGKSTPVEI